MRIALSIPIALRLCAVAAELSLMSLATHAQPCRVQIPIKVELQGKTVTLADLLPAGTCPWFVRVAANVVLGKAPPAGMARVLDGADLYSHLQAITKTDPEKSALAGMSIPERITVTRSGISPSCRELVEHLLPNAQNAANVRETDCSFPAGLSRGARLELAKKTWDPALRSWEFVARCSQPQTCVPFLIRVASQSEDSSPPPSDIVPTNAKNPAAIYPGQKSEVIWTQNGMRLLLFGMALDRGRTGDKIRVHLKSGPIITATVTNSGTLSWQK
ncbi:MAG TPA: flagella basal body P-ring formation protein FlgA [Candidatus Eisenbacteria bacterium]|nr:flagella basal body P-ring formation protein FlgA [Candidatus Eisenbacteria bacterium]